MHSKHAKVLNSIQLLKGIVRISLVSTFKNSIELSYALTQSTVPSANN